MDEQEKILDFLKEIADQLGPAGEQAFRIVAERVFAEALIWSLFGGLLIILSFVWLLAATILYRKSDNYNKTEAFVFFGLAPAIIIFCMGIWALVPSLMNIFSIEYATIARILNLVGGQ